MTTSHSSLSISHITFEFWVSFYQILHKNITNIKDASYDYLIIPFIDLFKIVLEKCKLRSFKLKPKDLKAYNSPKKQKNKTQNNEEDVVLIEEEEEENSGNKLSLSSYRGYSEDIFYNIYRILSEFREEQGTRLFFNLVNERLSKEFYLNAYAGFNEEEIMIEYFITIEATLFAVKSMLDNIIFSNSNPYIHEILKCVIREIPFEGVVVKTALQLIYDASEQLKFSQDIVEDVYKFVMQFVVDDKLGKLASQVFIFYHFFLFSFTNFCFICFSLKCFNSLTENLPKHQMSNVCDIVYAFIEKNIDNLDDEYIYENLIQGLFNIGFKISDPILVIFFFFIQMFIFYFLTIFSNFYYYFAIFITLLLFYIIITIF